MSSWLREHAAGFTLLNKQLRVLFGENLQGEIHYAEERRELLYLVNLLREAEWTCEGCRNLDCEWCRSCPLSPVPRTPSWLDADQLESIDMEGTEPSCHLCNAWARNRKLKQ